MFPLAIHAAAVVPFPQNHSDSDLSKVAMVASTVSSKFLKAMAAKEGFQFHETLTG